MPVEHTSRRIGFHARSPRFDLPPLHVARIRLRATSGAVDSVANVTELHHGELLAEAEIASEIYSTAGDYDLLAKFYVDNDTDIGHFVNEKVQVIPGIQDTHTIITFKAFGSK